MFQEFYRYKVSNSSSSNKIVTVNVIIFQKSNVKKMVFFFSVFIDKISTTWSC